MNREGEERNRLAERSRRDRFRVWRGGVGGAAGGDTAPGAAAGGGAGGGPERASKDWSPSRPSFELCSIRRRSDALLAGDGRDVGPLRRRATAETAAAAARGIETAPASMRGHAGFRPPVAIFCPIFARVG